MRKTAEERFLDKCVPEPNTGCWLWLASIGSDGYSKFWWNGESRHAHRFAYEHYVEPLGSYEACHSCDNPTCVSPYHVWKGTRLENVHDAVRKGRTAKGDRNGARKYIEHVPRGRIWHKTHKNPARGGSNGSRTHPERLRRGSKNGNAILTEALVAQLRQDRASLSLSQLAKKYGVSKRTALDISSWRTWRHVGVAPVRFRNPMLGPTGLGKVGSNT